MYAECMIIAEAVLIFIEFPPLDSCEKYGYCRGGPHLFCIPGHGCVCVIIAEAVLIFIEFLSLDVCGMCDDNQGGPHF